MPSLAHEDHRERQQEASDATRASTASIAKVASNTKEATSKFVGRAVLGGVAAGVSKVVAAPIERVKLLLQGQDELIAQGRLDKRYTGIIDCFKKIYAREGFLSFWRGTSANVIRIVPTQALNFSFKPLYNKAFSVSSDAPFSAQLASKMASGGAAGATSSLFVYPIDLARTRLANDAKTSTGGRQFNGILDVFRQIYKVDGVAGLYRGMVPSLIGAVVYRGTEFGLYDSLKPLLLKGSLESSFGASFAVGYFCTTCAGLLVFPFDSIRRRMMMTSGEAKHYRGFIDAFATIVRTSGFASLYSGAAANILRGIAGAGALSGYDALSRLAVRAKETVYDVNTS